MASSLPLSFALSTALVAAACTPAAEPAPPQDQAASAEEGTAPAEHPAQVQHADHDEAAEGAPREPREEASPLAGLSLNEGQRWLMDEHTRASIASMTETANSATLAALEDAPPIATSLDAELQRLIAGCTMEGPAHDELHTFLVTYIPAIARLSDATTTQEAQAALTNLQALLAEYQTYFQ